MILTDNSVLAEKCRTLRNYGLQDRDTLVEFGINSRLDSIQAAVGNMLLNDLADITSAQVRTASALDARLRGIAGITLSPRSGEVHQIFVLYVIYAE